MQHKATNQRQASHGANELWASGSLTCLGSHESESSREAESVLGAGGGAGFPLPRLSQCPAYWNGICRLYNLWKASCHIFYLNIFDILRRVFKRHSSHDQIRLVLILFGPSKQFTPYHYMSHTCGWDFDNSSSEQTQGSSRPGIIEDFINGTK